MICAPISFSAVLGDGWIMPKQLKFARGESLEAGWARDSM